MCSGACGFKIWKPCITWLQHVCVCALWSIWSQLVAIIVQCEVCNEPYGINASNMERWASIQ